MQIDAHSHTHIISKCNEKECVSFSEEVTIALESEGRIEHRLGFRGKGSRQKTVFKEDHSLFKELKVPRMAGR